MIVILLKSLCHQNTVGSGTTVHHCAKAFRAIRVSVIQIIIQAAQLFSVYLLMSVN